MDETKRYLIDIESNLKEYADLAVEAKKKVDDLTIANIKLQSSDATEAEKEAGLASLKNANDEYRKAASLVKTQIAANTSEVGSRKQLGETLKLQMQALGKLGNAYITNAKGQKELNPLYIEQRRQIAATKQAILDYDRSLNDGRSNIGRYGESVKAAFGNVKKNLLGMLAPAALITAGIAAVTKAIGALKQAFADTETGAAFFNKLSGRFKMFMQGLTEGKWKSMFGDMGDAAAAAADKLNKIRIGDRQDLKEIAEMETDIKLLRLESEKAITGSVEALNFLLAAEQKENELMDYKIKDKQEELDAIRENLKYRENDIDLLNRQTQLEVDLITIRGEKSLRIASKIKSTEDKMNKDSLKNIADLDKEKEKIFDAEQDRIKANQKALQKEIDDYIKAKDEEWEKEIEFQAKLYEFNREAGQKEWDARIEMEEALAEQILNIQETLTDSRMNLADSAANFLSAIAGDNKALQNAALIAEKAFAIAQVVINTTKANAAIRAGAAASVLPGPGYLARLFAAQAAAMAPINLNRVAAALDIAAIVAATASGLAGGSKRVSGGASAPTSITSAPATQRVFAAQTGSTVLNQPQLSQAQLNAIPQSGQLTAESIAAAFAKLPPPVVTVEDFNIKVNDMNKISVRANI